MIYPRPIWAVLALALALSSCQRVPPALGVEEVLHRSVEAAHSLETIHFHLDTQGMTAPLVGDLELVSAEGDLRRPGDLRAQVVLRTQGAVWESELVLVGDRLYLRDAFGSRFQELPVAARVALLDPSVGLAAALSEIASPELLGHPGGSGAVTYRIRGRIASARIAAMIGGEPAGTSVVIEAEARQGDWLVTHLDLSGAALVGDGADAVRRIEFSAWNAPLVITPPA